MSSSDISSSHSKSHKQSKIIFLPPRHTVKSINIIHTAPSYPQKPSSQKAQTFQLGWAQTLSLTLITTLSRIHSRLPNSQSHPLKDLTPLTKTNSEHTSAARIFTLIFSNLHPKAYAPMKFQPSLPQKYIRLVIPDCHQNTYSMECRPTVSVSAVCYQEFIYS